MSEKKDLSGNGIINSSSIAINTSRSINHNNDYFNDIIRPATLISLYNLGFNLVPLSENHKPVVDWSSVYGNPGYWKIENFDNQATYSKFINVASTLGKTHIKDIENRDLYLQVLDIDSEYIHDILSKRLSQIINSNDGAKSIIQEFLKSIGITDVNQYDDLTILEICKKNTFVTKTKKPCGYHIWWLSYMQNESIHTKDCKNGFEFEIKTKKELCTLPPSSHRDDKNFRYQAVGRKDKIIENDFLYTLFIRAFSNCLENNKQNQENNNSVIKNSDIRQQKNTFFNDLSNQTVQKSIEYLLPYYINGSRNDFVLSFSGAAFHSKISEESASSIIEGICKKTCDNEKQNRLITLHSTYKKGIENKAITGASSLIEVIGHTKGQDQTVGKGIIDTLKKLWQQDILNKYDIHDIEKEKDKPTELSIVQAIRAQQGFVQVKGTIVGRSSVYNFIKSVTWICSVCKSESKIELTIPSFKSPYKNEKSCRTCIGEDSNLRNTAIATFEYISVVDIELQDLDEHNEIERLSVKIFGNDTYDVIAGELVSIIGHLRVIRKNDNSRNKLETVLFAGSIFYTKRQELVLTDDDKKQIQNWKQLQIQRNKNPIDELASLLAPELIELDNVKKGMLLVCASAGLRNVNGMFPKRSRLNALLIGDPGLAKTALLEKTVKLISNSQYTGGQSSTGLSLTSHVHNDESGSYALRFGPVVLAKDSICAINELGQLPIEHHKHLLDCMEENGFAIAKHGFSTFVEAHPSIIASANPINNKWQNGESISFSEFPTLLQIIQRFDLIFIFRENRDVTYLERYVDERKRIADNYKKGIYEKDEEFLKKYLLYARTFKTELNDEASSILRQFFISMGASGISGLPRKFDSLMRITMSIAKLKLKNSADAEDANETILLYNDILKDFNQVVAISKNPRDLSFDMIRKIIREYNGHPIFLTTAAVEACKRDPNIKYYLLGKDFQGNNHKDIAENLKLNKSHHLKEVLSLLRNDACIQIVKEKPVEVRWKTESENENEKDKGTSRDSITQ